MSDSGKQEVSNNAQPSMEEYLTVSEGVKLIQDRSFINLDWKSECQHNLTFKHCTITDADFAGSNLDGLRLEDCLILNCDFSTCDFYRAELFDITINECQAQGCNFELADFVSIVN